MSLLSSLMERLSVLFDPCRQPLRVDDRNLIVAVGMQADIGHAGAGSMLRVDPAPLLMLNHSMDHLTGEDGGSAEHAMQIPNLTGLALGGAALLAGHDMIPFLAAESPKGWGLRRRKDARGLKTPLAVLASLRFRMPLGSQGKLAKKLAQGFC